MIQITKMIIEQFAQLLSFLVPSSLSENCRACKSHFYTGFLKRRFASWGRNSIIAYRAYVLKGMKYISIGTNTQVEKNVQLMAWKQDGEERLRIKIGDDCLIRQGTSISAMNSVEIGNHLLTGVNFLITDNAHGGFEESQLKIPPKKRPLFSKGPVKIGHHVWLGNNVCVLSGVTIGDRVVIGANSVVNKDIPSDCIAAGIPAKVVKQLK